MRLLVTGTGRCGTQWMAAALTAAGVQCTHEVHWTRRRAGDGNWRAEASWPAAAHLPAPPDVRVVLLVRHPLAVIRSRLAGGLFTDQPPWPKLAAWMYKMAPEVAGWGTPLERAAAHWVVWNQLAQPWAAERLRLEDVTADDVTRLARLVDPTAAGINDLPPPVGSRPSPGPEVTWAQVEHIPSLLDLATAYGYR